METSDNASKGANGGVRSGKAIAKMSFEIDDASLKQVIRSGQIREFAATAASLAAAHISAQLVDKLADMAAGGASTGMGATFIFDDGDFGTIPPRPKFGIGVLHRADFLQRVADIGEQRFG